MQVAVLSLLPTEMLYHQRTLPRGDGVRVLALLDPAKEEVVAIIFYSAKRQTSDVRGQQSGDW